MIHQTNIYQIEYEKYLFFRRIQIFLISFFLCFAAALFMKVLTRGVEPSAITQDYKVGGFTYGIYDDNTAKLVKYDGGEKEVVIPSKVSYNGQDYPVTTIGNQAFKDNTTITSVTGDSIEKIEDHKTGSYNDLGYSAFYDCIYLEKISFKNAKLIGNFAFRNCSSLQTVELPKALDVGFSAFRFCRTLEKISLPEALYIGEQSFEECNVLQEVDLPKAQYVGSFKNCYNLREVILPEALFIGIKSFYNCYALKRVDIPKATYIQPNAFWYCGSLREVNASNLVYLESNDDNFEKLNTTIFKLPKSMKNFNLESYSNENFNFEYIYDAPTIAVINNESERDAKFQEIKDQYMKKYNLASHGINLDNKSTFIKSYNMAPGRNSKYHIYYIRTSEDSYELTLSGWASGDDYVLILQTDVSADMTVQDAEYDGTEHKPTVSISKDGDYALQEGEDYKITGDFVNAGEQTATLEFIGMYKGMDSITKTFTITPKNATNFDVEYEKVHIYDGKQPEFKIKDGEKELVLGTDYKIVSDKDIKEIGTHNVKIQYIGNYTGEKDIEFEVVADKSNWGEEVNNGGVINYVDSHGKTSAEVTGKEMIWLKESSDGTSAWYAIDNTNGTFKQGSRFWTQWLSPEANKEEFEKYYNKLDDEHKNQVENNKLWIFLTGVTDPDGNDYSNLDGTVNYYIQLGEDWDEDDVKAVFISDKNDDVLQVLFEDVNTPEGTFKCAKILMQHFSPYAVYDPIDSTVPDTVPDDQKKEPEEKQKNDNNESLIPNDDKNSNNGKNFLINPTKENFGQAIKSGLIAKISVLIFLILIPSVLIFNKIIKKTKINKD